MSGSMAVFVAALVPACTGTDGGAVDLPLAAAPAAAEPSVALRIERVARALDRGEDASKARADIDAVLRDPAATATERDEATLTLSRALEATGDKEGAIVAVEQLLAGHAADREWTASAEAERRLRKLVTATDEAPKRKLQPQLPAVSKFARALVKYFPPDAAGTVNVRVVAFGGRAEASDRLGTFNVAAAVKEAKEKSCPSCSASVSGNVSRESSWLGIPRLRAALGAALVVHYFDLEGGQIPSRYDAELPLPAAEVASRLARGEGLVAVRERPGLPPVILIAAPRFAQLDNVEDVLSQMDALPGEPTSIQVPASLEAEEIQSVVRASFGQFRACYESLLNDNPQASGRIILDFAVSPGGSVSQVKANAEAAALESMQDCMKNATETLVFPAAAKETTVVYPVLFTPG
jgi:hypothetical protein